MAVKWVKAVDDVHRLGNEKKESSDTRKYTAKVILNWLAEKEFIARLYQQVSIDIGKGNWQKSDFVVKFPDGQIQAIEIGLLGTERYEALFKACDDVVRVRHMQLSTTRVCRKRRANAPSFRREVFYVRR